jgi:bifunctional N-acetylglucosamine-1-phosphate-uridyltransferase/glucosamine-1-phosphate-acetyltransferase GlmU-like protein
MYRAAIESLPAAKNEVVVSLKKVEEFVKKDRDPRVKAVILSETPPGQALSTEAGLEKIDSSGDIIVSACDHGIVLSPEVWEDFRNDPACDAAIFTYRGFPGVLENPDAFAYVLSDKNGFVQSVSVKKTVSDRPMHDDLLVGTFWFKNKEVLRKGISLLKMKNLKVNDELYLDSVFELLIKDGHSVKKIALEGYIGWGTPQALSESLYWEEVFCGRKVLPREKFPGVMSHAKI